MSNRLTIAIQTVISVINHQYKNLANNQKYHQCNKIVNKNRKTFINYFRSY